MAGTVGEGTVHMPDACSLLHLVFCDPDGTVIEMRILARAILLKINFKIQEYGAIKAYLGAGGFSSSGRTPAKQTTRP